MKAYVIVAGCGDYSSRCEQPYRVYTDKLHAELAMSVLDGISNKYGGLWGAANADYRRVEKDAVAAYEQAGFASSDDWHLGAGTDWALHEVELVA